VTCGSTIATPRQAPFDEAIASSIARLSVPWQLACTRTARDKAEAPVQRGECLLCASAACSAAPASTEAGAGTEDVAMGVARTRRAM